jgi:hypothetical protein
VDEDGDIVGEGMWMRMEYIKVVCASVRRNNRWWGSGLEDGRSRQEQMEGHS